MKYFMILGMLLLFGCVDQRIDPPIDPEAKFTLLEDLIHAKRQTTEVVASFDQLDYNKSHGYSAFATYLGALDGGLSRVRNGRLSSEILKDVDILFVNLTDDQVKDFNETEVDAVEEFVSQGGALLVIVDHTNAYGGTARINTLLDPFELEVTYEMALDARENTLKHNHWLLMAPERTEAEHFIFEGVRQHAYFAAGPILGPGSLAWTSDQGWRDKWDESHSPSFWGDFVQEEDEPTQSSSVMNAVEHGEGRVVVVGDQNMFGNSLLGFADNQVVLANIFQWLVQAEEETAFRKTRVEKPEIYFDFRGIDATQYGDSSYSSFFTSMSRQDTFKGFLLLDEPARTPEYLFVAEAMTYEVSEEDPAYPSKVLDDGGEVFFFLDPIEPEPAALALIQTFWPEFEPPQVGEGDFAGATFGGIDTRTIEVEDDVADVTSSVGESVYWLEKGNARSDIIVKKESIYVIVQPTLLRRGAYILTREALFNDIAERRNSED